MENNQKKNEVNKAEKKENIVNEQLNEATSSYVKISELTKEQILKLNKCEVIFVPRRSKSTNSFTYQLDLFPKVISINDLGDLSKNRVNLSLSEFNAARLFNKKTEEKYLKDRFIGTAFYRLVKGFKEDNKPYFSVQYWLSPYTDVHVHFFDPIELIYLSGLKKLGKLDINFILKPAEAENEKFEFNSDKDFDIEDL